MLKNKAVKNKMTSKVVHECDNCGNILEEDVGQYIGVDSHSEEYREWLRDVDGEDYCPKCKEEMKNSLDSKDASDEVDTE